MSLILTDDELIELTGKRQRKKQIEVLSALDIDFRVRLDGFPVVYRDALQLQSQPKKRTKKEPDFRAVGR